jgi:hypothetical protein
MKNFNIYNALSRVFFLLLLSVYLTNCDYAKGTLGGSQDITFRIPKKQLGKGIDDFLLKNPEYKIPEKWKKLDDWDQRGLGFLKGKIIYFKNSPEEMYYVTISEDPVDVNTTSIINVRAVNGGWSWNNYADIKETEKLRVEQRFYREIVLNIQKVTKINAVTTK